MNRYILTILIFSISVISAYAQSGYKVLDSYMSEVREGSYKPVPEEILKTNNEKELFSGLEFYVSDTLNMVRSKAYYIFKRVGQRSEDEEIRAAAISHLITGIKDTDSGISGNASEALTGFKKDDFTGNHKENIASLLKVEVPHLDQVLKLAGYLELTDYKDQINAIINLQAPFKYKWAARLALARMGDQRAIAYMLNKLQQAPVNDNFVYDVVPDLVYTRQMEIFNFLELVIQSDQQNCQSADPDSGDQILCGYRVMEYMAPAIEGYPLPTDEFGDIEVDDYEKALQEVRTWFNQNETYVIDRDTF